jgi:hypothetical protein
MYDERIDTMDQLLKATAPIIIAVAAEPILLGVVVGVTAALACVTVTFWIRDKYA